MSNIKTIQITLAKPHTHAGTRHAAGATIAVSAADAAWLEANGIGAAQALTTDVPKQSRPTTSKMLGVKDE